MNAALAFLYAVLSQVLSFVAIQGSYKIPYLRNSLWLPVIMGIPISYLIIKSGHYFIEAFNGEVYPSRLLGQSIGVITFVIMSRIMFNEPITVKSAVCIFLAFLIMLIQLFWK